MDINYINELLDQGKKVAEVRQILGIGRNKFQDNIKSLGYEWSSKTKRYEYAKNHTKDISKVCDKGMPEVIQEQHKTIDNGIILTSDKGNTISIQEELKDNIINLANNFDKIQNIIKWFENREYDKEPIEVIQVDNGLKINLPDSEIVRTTIRANKKVLDDFNDFSNKYKEYNKQDLISMALKEYMERYK